MYPSHIYIIVNRGKNIVPARKQPPSLVSIQNPLSNYYPRSSRSLFLLLYSLFSSSYISLENFVSRWPRHYSIQYKVRNKFLLEIFFHSSDIYTFNMLLNLIMTMRFNNNLLSYYNNFKSISYKI